ncbi:uncharacterized protein [Argopecten irradians]|uniref:uncharacterized protein isoform X2 n=1 Tax=Argopecten irradians TaxID=31199 RepID=UPI00371FC388
MDICVTLFCDAFNLQTVWCRIETQHGGDILLEIENVNRMFFTNEEEELGIKALLRKYVRVNRVNWRRMLATLEPSGTDLPGAVNTANIYKALRPAFTAMQNIPFAG